MMKNMPLNALRISLSALALAVLGACSLVPEYERPATPVATGWPGESAATEDSELAAADIPWQDFVRDGGLHELIGLALQNNLDLRVAIENIELVRAQYQIERAGQFPTVGVAASGSRSEPNPARAMGGPKVSSNYSVGLGVSAWELDFFGRVAALKDAALADYLATREARKSAQISLIASVVASWLQLKTDTELLALAERTLATRQQSLDLIQLRYDHGASSALELRQAQTLTASAKAARAQQQRLRAQDINLLTLLVGAPLPTGLVPEVPISPAPTAPNLDEPMTAAAPVPPLPEFADIPAGLPSDLLLRRPDIRAAEQRLVAANANIGAARANFFPRISLTGSLGWVSTDLDGLLGAGGQKAWSFGPSLDLPIFDAGRRQSGLEAAEAQQRIAVARYEQAIQLAFREVADALAARTTLADQLKALQEQAEAERESFRLADLRYRNGVASYLNLLDAQRSLFAAEQQLAQIQLAQRVNELELYKALGGGWVDQPDGVAEPLQENPDSPDMQAHRQRL